MRTMLDKYYSQLIVFYYVVDYMSFTQAADYLNCSKAHVSKQITDLERSVGSALLYRNTRSLRLTLPGEALFKHAQSIINELQQIEHTVSALQNKAEGVLRITSPRGYADYVLAPNLYKFFEEYPEVSLEMNHGGALLNLVKEKIDIAIRITHEPPLDKVAKQLGLDRMILCASKRYLEKYGVPKTPKQLHEHSCLVYSSEKSKNNWPFLDKNQPINVMVKAKMTSNSAQLLLAAALNGSGIARLPQYIVNENIKNGSLCAILGDFVAYDKPIYAIFSQVRIISPKVQAFIKFLTEIHATV